MAKWLKAEMNTVGVGVKGLGLGTQLVNYAYARPEVIARPVGLRLQTDRQLKIGTHRRDNTSATINFRHYL